MTTNVPAINNNPTRRKLGVILYSIGILTGVVVMTAVTWAFLEADFYFGYGAPAKEPLLTLNCPIVMTTHETATITLDLDNPLDKVVEPVVDIDISNPGLFRNIRTKSTIEPGTTKQLQWTVSSADVVFGHLVMMTVYVFPVSSLPSRHGTCGILALNVPYLSGSAILVIFIALACVNIVAGGLLFTLNNRPLSRRGIMTAVSMLLLAGFVIAGIVVSIQGIWLAGILFLGLTLLLTLAIAMYFAQ